MEQFATRVQTLLVQYLRARYGDDTANWCETFWTGDRGRYCLVHSRYAGCNNNMGVEVTWRDIKRTCNIGMRLGAFVSALCHFIATALGEENMMRLKDDSGLPDAFISTPRPTKEMFDIVQDAHRLTLSCCIVIESFKAHAQDAFIDLIAEVMECGTDATPLHMKIAMYHHERAQRGDKLPIELAEVKEVLMPRLRLLKLVDPDGEYEFNAPQMRRLIKPHAEEYKRVVLKDQLPPGMTVKEALKVYGNFKLLTGRPSWGKVPLACTCKTCFGYAICADTLLFVSLFDPEVHVPKRWITATVSERKKVKSIGGLAGRKKMRVLDEMKDDEKLIHSKASLLAENEKAPSPRAEPSPRAAPARRVLPEAVLPTDDEEESDDFEVSIRFGVWCHDTDCPCGCCRMSLLDRGEHGRGGRLRRVAIPLPVPPPQVSRPRVEHRDRHRGAGGHRHSRLRLLAHRRNRYLDNDNFVTEMNENAETVPLYPVSEQGKAGRRASGRSSGAGRG